MRPSPRRRRCAGPRHGAAVPRRRRGCRCWRARAAGGSAGRRVSPAVRCCRSRPRRRPGRRSRPARPSRRRACPGPRARWGVNLSKNRSSSTGTGMTRVLFFSAATSTTVCNSRSCSAAGSRAITLAAAASRLDAWYSPSAVMIRGAALPLRLGLPRHRPLHALRQRHVLDLHPLHPDAPRALGGLVDDPAQLPVHAVPLGQQLVHLGLADDRAQRGLRLLGDREHVVLHVDGRLDRVDHPEVDHRVDPHGHVVLGDPVLRRDRHRHDLHVDLLHPVADRPDHGQPGAARQAQHLPEPEDDALLVLLHDLKRAAGGDKPGRDEYDQDDHQDNHRQRLFSDDPVPAGRRRRPSPVPAPSVSTRPETSKKFLETVTQAVRDGPQFPDQPRPGG